MTTDKTVPNGLINETSPYLLQHAYNPVDWYPWGEDAFAKAKAEDKPVFLSIGYSTCHWCHVMAHESFEDNEVARILNKNFVSIKVDKEERPDVDSIYMNVCGAFTGSGGWPLTIIMTPHQKPFFAGTYFPKYARYGSFGLMDLLNTVLEKWTNEKENLIKSGNEITAALCKQPNTGNGNISKSIIEKALHTFKNSFDSIYGGFGAAPKFPAPHNLMFLLSEYEYMNNAQALQMAEKTLLQMFKGGIFDHIGFGFSRYSTDRHWLAPHFEKMLYDNALLTIAYLKAYAITSNGLYKNVAIKTMDYVLRELTSPEGGFYCAQDADSEGVEGKYYVFTPDEITALLGREDGERFNHYFDITPKGNFEGKNIPNLIKTKELDDSINILSDKVYQYRESRTRLHKDDKILTSWNALMISAFAAAYKTLGDKKYLDAACKAFQFIEDHLSAQDQLFVSFRDGKSSQNAFLDDYAFYVFAHISMYEATFEKSYMEKAVIVNNKIIADFYDGESGGFFLYGKNNEQLILRPKETYDGAIPSGNSVMSYNLLKLARFTKNADLNDMAKNQLSFMSAHANSYPSGHSFFLLALQLFLYPAKEIVCVLKDKEDQEKFRSKFPSNATVIILDKETQEYPLKNDKTTFYICEENSCKPPVNEL